jgi:anti-sigma B factor antagonist
MKANLSTNIRSQNSISVIDIQGEINAYAERELMEAFTQAATQGARAIILNFTSLDYMNSSGIGLLVTLLIRAKRQNLRLLAYGLTTHYRQIFELTRLDEVISIYENENEATAAASEPASSSSKFFG